MSADLLPQGEGELEKVPGRFFQHINLTVTFGFNPIRNMYTIMQRDSTIMYHTVMQEWMEFLHKNFLSTARHTSITSLVTSYMQLAAVIGWGCLALANKMETGPYGMLMASCIMVCSRLTQALHYGVLTIGGNQQWVNVTMTLTPSTVAVTDELYSCSDNIMMMCFW